ncbi:MAG: PD40 domain-containing protein [Candidatus Coatesbacteria bacterium]|nr:MAG: PD40 domain-containing protein [Candidatus Coatesbacteria bacterium]
MLKQISLLGALAVAASSFAAWQTPVNLGSPLNTSANEWYPFLSQNGRWMVFASDRTGGQGGADLWRSDYYGGAWQPPVNLGYYVNSSSGESTPFLADSDTRLYFISTAPGGQGSADIWWVPLRGGTPIAARVNLGPPINTAFIDC